MEDRIERRQVMKSAGARRGGVEGDRQVNVITVGMLLRTRASCRQAIVHGGGRHTMECFFNEGDAKRQHSTNALYARASYYNHTRRSTVANITDIVATIHGEQAL